MSDFPALHTPRLVLREIVPADAPALFAIHGDADLMRWFGADPLPDLEAAVRLVARFADWRRQASPGTRWGLQLKGKRQLVGSCGLFGWNRNFKRCVVGYELASEWQGRGLMREALACVLDWGFANMGLHRVEAQIHPQNAPSLKLAASLGFVPEGLLREAGYWAGRHHDLLQYSLLRHEFVATPWHGRPSNAKA
ncbi:MAG TPA: GNAT family protein [Rhodopila sp.]|nr:GNAT family protein [Rhodopila sp.]